MTGVVVKVSKSSPVMVKPCDEPVATAGGAVNNKLSLLDQVHMNIPVTLLMVFEHPISEQAPAETAIRRGLSRALVHYYPVAGRIAPGADDEIGCTGEGVAFVAASADCSVVQSGLLKEEQAGAAASTTRALLDDLAVYYDDPAAAADGGCVVGGGPLLMVQVTEFSCGGFVVGVTWNHAVADTAGIAQFLRAVGEMARGWPAPSVRPTRTWDDSMVPSLSPSVVAAIRQRSGSAADPPPSSLDDLAFLDVTVQRSLIDRVRAEYARSSHAGRSSSSPCTTFEAVAAVLWRCRTRAIITSSSSPPSSSPTVLSFAVNIRRHVGRRRAGDDVDGYYGNAVAATGQKVVSTVGAVAHGSIADVIQAIKDSKEGVADMLRGTNPSSSSQQQQQQLVDRYSMLAVSSWGNLGLDQPDFGSGTPARVIFHARPLASPQPFCMMCLPWKGIDGVIVMSLYVRKEHADAFLDELDRLHIGTA